MSTEMYYIYLNGFWAEFASKTDAIHVGLIEQIFQETKLKNVEITTDINKANVLIESLFNNSLTTFKQWKYTIYFSGEAWQMHNKPTYDLELDSDNAITKPYQHNVVDMPLCIFYTYNNRFFERLISRPYINKVPSEFCCFMVSNPNGHVRNKMFEMLNNYKNVHSYGKFANNMNNHYIQQYNYWQDEYCNFIGRYKFMICFENTKKGTYITEKIVNPYLARIVPIYWGTHHVKNVFNPESMLFLEDESDESYSKLVNRIIELDNNDEKYLEFVNNPTLNESNVEYWTNNYTIKALAKKIDNIIR